MGDDKSLPNTVDALLDYLDATYPDRCPSPMLSEREVWMASGARCVVNHLLHLKSVRDDNIMPPPE